eukprot:scaffold54604_cov73-Cyclotella_meneghiniana.AAC.6
MNNNKRINPFRSIDKNNFPPLNDFFGRPPTAPAKLASPDESLCSNKSSTVSPTKCDDFILDMSIAGRAAMAEHNSRIRKHGIDGDNTPSDRNSSLSDSDDWGRLMDDTCTDVSFSSSAFVNSQLNGSRDRSRDADTSADTTSSYFDKSVIHSLLTPEKVRSQSADDRLTLQRGQALYENDDSPNSLTSGCCTNIGSRCSGVEEMFHAALRFHNDLQESGDSKSGKDKSSSVSFAADTSFLGGEGRSTARRKRPSDDNNAIEDLNFLFGSPINKNDDSFAASSSFFGSPISPSLSGVEKEIKHSPSSSLVSNKSSLHIKTTPSGAEGPSLASILGLTPDQSELEDNDRILKKNLFQSETEPIMTVECAITEDSIELVHSTPNKLKLRDNNIETTVRTRMFGLDAASRFNQCSNVKEKQIKTPNIDLRPKLPHDVPNTLNDENVRGVRLCRASKLKALGFVESSVCSSRSWSSHDDSGDRSDF